MRLIDGAKARVPGNKIECTRCKQMIDESKFYFNVTGYSSYCISCHREYLKEQREKHRDELVGQNGVTRHSKQEEVSEEDYLYKKELEKIYKSIRVGDTIASRGKTFTVIAVTGRYVTLRNAYGVNDSYLYDDMYKILHNKYRFRGEEDEKSKEQNYVKF